MSKIDIYINQIEQLKKVLEFYSDEDNWNKDIVLKDRGFFAKETLKQIKNNTCATTNARQ